MSLYIKRYAFLIVLFFLFCLKSTMANNALNGNNNSLTKETINYTVTVVDKNTLAPLQYVVVVLKEGNSTVASASTNPFGRASFKDLQSGYYILSTHYVGYEDFSDSVAVDSLHKTYMVKLGEKNLQLDEIVIQGNKMQNGSTQIDMITGRQVFETQTYHASPSASMTQLIEQNLAGAAKAPTGEVHIRGQHGEFTYLVDGIPIPLGVFGGLNEIVDPKVISKVTFYTGGFPAEYGGQIAGLMDIQNRVPTGRFHMDVSSYLGSYLSPNENSGLNSNGQSISLSDHAGKLGYFFGASRQETDRRIDQPTEQLFHDHGFDYFTYGKLDYLLNEHDYLTMNLNFSKTKTQIPYDPVEGFRSDDQSSYNAFQTISYFHTISSDPENETNLFIGGFAREGGLRFLPGVNDANKVFLNNDSTTGYVVDQNRTFSTLGLRAKYDQRLSHHFKYAFGVNYGSTFGKEDFRFFNSSASSIENNSDFSGYDMGAFAETEWHPYEWTRLDLGLRYDVHNSPSIPNQSQLSPRVKLNLFIDEFNSFSLSYDRLFMPTNIENLGAVASQFGKVTSPALPEKDDLYEISLLRNWKNGFSSKLSGFFKFASPGLDDQTLGSSTIKVNVNINEVKVTGLELALIYSDQDNPFGAYINASLIHAYGTGPVSGGFLPEDPSTAPFDLDHDQRLSAVIGLNYQPSSWFVNLTASYASGLTNGNDSYNFKTGLFDFNQGAHTTPSWIVDASFGYAFDLLKGQSIEPSIYITNIFDHAHLIKGAFFSGASFEERRNVVFKLLFTI
ncbi:MAG: TonB-dependent receptor [Bacteroidota bacterium]|nr:TonB-dependent receptor [Bacteroidota bacterium]